MPIIVPIGIAISIDVFPLSKSGVNSRTSNPYIFLASFLIRYLTSTSYWEAMGTRRIMLQN